MRWFTAFIFVFGLLVCGTGCTESVQSDGQSDLAVGDGEVRVYEVFGMDCPGCHGGLEKLVLKIPSVAEARANWEAKELTVVLEANAEINDEDVFDAIRRANFTPGKRIR